MNRPDISGLQKNRAIYLKLGFVGALSFVLLAFNWTTDFYVPSTEPIADMVTFEEIPIQRTKQEKKRLPPPPVVEPTLEPLIEDVEITEEPIPEKIEAISLPEPPIAQRPSTPVALPPPPPPPLPKAPEKFAPKDEIFEVVEEMPRFPGCEDSDLTKAEKQQCAQKKMLEFIYDKINYPSIAVETRVEGTAVLRFVVEKDGRISDLKIVRDPGAGLGAEALRVAKTMPRWHPGKQRGNAVRVHFNLPVRYILE